MSEDFVPLADSLDEVVRALRPDRQRAGAVSARAVGGVFGRWEEAVGELIAANVAPLRLDGEVLTVEVADPVWVPQVAFFETTICARLLEVVGATVTRLEVRVARPGQYRRTKTAGGEESPAGTARTTRPRR